jgi:hypothetical protein
MWKTNSPRKSQKAQFFAARVAKCVQSGVGVSVPLIAFFQLLVRQWVRAKTLVDSIFV